MAEKKRGLGKSLDLLLSTVKTTTEPLTFHENNKVFLEEQLSKIPIELLQPGKYQPRRDIQPQALQELADSMRRQGIIQPLVVRLISKDKYEIIAGERRWRAAQLAGINEVPVIIRNVPDEAAIAMALIENIQRENLNPIDEAFALQRLLQEFQLTHQEVAEAVGKSRTTITNILRLTHLDEDVQRLLAQGDIETGHAKVLLALEEQNQRVAAQKIVSQRLSVRETEALVKRLQNSNLPQPEKKTDPNIRSLQQQLSEQLGTLVKIQHTKTGKGKLTIHYNTTDEFAGILAQFKTNLIS
ncbi:MAG: putative chromosome-partitioning protein ParB [Legionellaceae bacterium]